MLVYVNLFGILLQKQQEHYDDHRRENIKHPNHTHTLTDTHTRDTHIFLLISKVKVEICEKNGHQIKMVMFCRR